MLEFHISSPLSLEVAQHELMDFGQLVQAFLDTQARAGDEFQRDSL
jgi:hypothetical protein